MADSVTPSRGYEFTSHPSVSQFAVPFPTYVANQAALVEGLNYEYVAVGALVFARFPAATDATNSTHTEHGKNDELRVLLVQRAPHDSAPLRWEVPGGASDREDPTILHSVARELWEEAGLAAKSIRSLVGQGHVFLTRGGKRVCKFEFLVEVEGGGTEALMVKLDPNEHVNSVWATEEECRDGRMKRENIELAFTTWQQKQTLLEGFRLQKELNGMSFTG
ncbi:uncharacterized protein Z519_12577 [Cladophialophora bantiana CBS 173.52]|uniref:Nudix hydrolase domain-containing protein n=1 Tax=Cladophialophora bantiana (strain ATCC 10958 / CBS 173.52 / CDC B-1940 / NIH 8579) TaxID=1442370 RepID=A0A0D2E9I5_CLAB1|nr:uncharacterized protein Z519_12577 [Cladophialophora bantiana CBS 173.52]KIW86791.1 hypothetical protein Z519_12577 [Cladophialophora bantiana CBS 173.52]